MRALDVTATYWRKSSYSNQDGGQCLEVADGLPGVLPVRDSKAPELNLAFPAGSWQAFVASVERAQRPA